MPLQPKQEPPYYEITTGPTPAAGAKYYIALLNQSGTDAPTQQILYNTLSNTPTWTRSAMGLYICTLANAFPTNKVAIVFGTGYSSKTFIGGSEDTPPNSIYIDTYDETGTSNDGLLQNTTIQITVYP